MPSLPSTSTEDVIDQPVRVQLEVFLDEHRSELNRCLDGLTEEQARRSLVPSKTTLLGLVKHATFVEKVWFDEAVTCRSRPEIGTAATPDESFVLLDGDTIATVQQAHRQAYESSRRATASLGLDDIIHGNRRGPLALRWVYLHRAAVIELLASPDVGTYLGGPRPREEIEREMPGTPERPPGLFTVDLSGAVIGQVILRRAAAGPSRGAGKAELGYLFLPRAWGFGYAAEACVVALDWLGHTLPGEPVVLFTQTANARSMRLAAKLGFTEVERYEAWGAEQWFGMRSPVTPSD